MAAVVKILAFKKNYQTNFKQGAFICKCRNMNSLRITFRHEFLMFLDVNCCPPLARSHGVDDKKRPILWYRIERMNWDKIVLKKRLQYTDVVLSSGLDEMASCDVHGLNFVLLVDDFSPMQMLKNPRIGPAFFKSFIKRCPEKCLQKAIMVTGDAGSVFYNIVKRLAPRSFTDRIIVVNSRGQAASLLQDMGVFKSKHDIPSFLGGDAEDHPDDVSKVLPTMMVSLRAAMNNGIFGGIKKED